MSRLTAMLPQYAEDMPAKSCEVIRDGQGGQLNFEFEAYLSNAISGLGGNAGTLISEGDSCFRPAADDVQALAALRMLARLTQFHAACPSRIGIARPVLYSFG
jgi:hypothetical protein